MTIKLDFNCTTNLACLNTCLTTFGTVVLVCFYYAREINEIVVIYIYLDEEIYMAQNYRLFYLIRFNGNRYNNNNNKIKIILYMYHLTAEIIVIYLKNN